MTAAIRGKVHSERMDYADAVADLERAIALDASRKAALQPEIDKIKVWLG